MSAHPIPLGRRAALHDRSLWMPLAGMVSRMMAHFGIEAERAGEILTAGMMAGEIGHMAEEGDDWIVSPRGAELLRRTGFDYETMIGWGSGTIRRHGGPEITVLVFWPDVERAARGKTFGPVIEGELAAAPPTLIASGGTKVKRGPKSAKTGAAAAAMLADLRGNKQSVATLRAMKQKCLASLYNVGSRDTAMKALNKAVSEFVGVSNPDL